MPPNYFVSYTNDEKKIIKSKPTIPDSVNSVFIVSDSVNDIKVKIDALREEKLKKKQTFQPIVAIILTDKLIKQIFVYCDGIFYEINSIVSALDICFKTFHVLNLSYPKESYNFYFFIQKYFYEISTRYDKPVSTVSNLITELKPTKNNLKEPIVNLIP